MATIREWLDYSGFDWERGEILWQEVTAGDYCPGWGTPKTGMMIDKTHSILDEEFDDGFGAPRCPRFLARDNRRIYFPYQYDGSTACCDVELNWSVYLGDKPNETPYPGG